MNKIKFDENGLIPAIIQDYETGTVLMLAYMNEESLKETVETKKTVFYSRSRKQIWRKGETSSHYQHVKEIRTDCDNDAILILVKQDGAACHTNEYSCFFNGIEDDEKHAPISFCSDKTLTTLYERVKDRKLNPKDGSYTNYLFDKGIDKILKKVGEETAEVIIASKNNSKEEITNEVSDLLYHLMVMLVDRGIKPEEIYKVLDDRKK